MLVYYYILAAWGNTFMDKPIEHPLYKETTPHTVFYGEPCQPPTNKPTGKTIRVVGDTVFCNRLAADGYSNDGGGWVVLKNIEL